MCSTLHTLFSLTYIFAAPNVLESVVKCYKSLQSVQLKSSEDPIAKEKLVLAFTSKLLERVKDMGKFLEAVKPARVRFPCMGEKGLFPATR